MTVKVSDSGHNCVFCSIIAGNTEAIWEARPSSETRVVCFHNRLKWADVMLLIIPTEHLTQKELWSSDVLIDASQMAVEMGDKHCSDVGYRVISNFGVQAHQSQSHGHIHVVSGMSRLLQSASSKSPINMQDRTDVMEYDVEDTPFAAKISPTNNRSQRELWRSEQILEISRAALNTSMRYSPNGFRLMSSFEPASRSALEASNPAGLFLLGGGQLGLYV